MIDELRYGALLSALSPTHLERVSRHAARIDLDEGQMLFSQGDAADRFFLMLQGQVKLFRLSPDGAEKVIEIIASRQTFAEALMFLNAPRYPVCASALSPAQLIAMDARDFAAMLRESVDTCFLVLGALSQRLRGLVCEIDNLTLHTAASRVARYLLDHLPEDRRALDLDIRKSVLASRLSVKPETFSRVIKHLSQEGIIEVHGSHFTIVARGSLEEIAELDSTPELRPVPCAARAATSS
jgi:CRP-like cAMP-binding protein